MPENVHKMNTDIPAGVGAPPFDTPLSNTLSQAVNDQIRDQLSQAIILCE